MKEIRQTVRQFYRMTDSKNSIESWDRFSMLFVVSRAPPPLTAQKKVEIDDLAAEFTLRTRSERSTQRLENLRRSVPI